MLLPASEHVKVDDLIRVKLSFSRTINENLDLNYATIICINLPLFFSPSGALEVTIVDNHPAQSNPVQCALWSN